jgi:hypothetical protein
MATRYSFPSRTPLNKVPQLQYKSASVALHYNINVVHFAVVTHLLPAVSAKFLTVDKHQELLLI